MVPTDTRTLEEILTLAKDAGVEYLRVGDVELRFFPSSPEQLPTAHPPGWLGPVGGKQTARPDLMKLFKNNPPTFNAPKGDE